MLYFIVGSVNDTKVVPTIYVMEKWCTVPRSMINRDLLEIYFKLLVLTIRTKHIRFLETKIF